MFKRIMKEKTELKIRVKNGNKEIETSIPWSERTASVSVVGDTSPRGILDMIEVMVKQLNKLEG